MENAERQLAEFIDKFDPENAELILAVRLALQKRMPSANEIVYDNYNFFVIGYSSTSRPSDCMVSLVASSKGVSLSFYYGASLADPERRLLGDGKQNRFIRIPDARLLRQAGVDSLIQAAIDNGKHPLACSGKGSLVIKSISSKQRPRR